MLRTLPVLSVTVADQTCVLPLECVIEVLRRLPVVPMTASPPFVLGLSTIRGAPLVVVDLGAVLGLSPGSRDRLVTVRTGAATVAIAVDSVAGVTRLDTSALEALPALCSAAGDDVVSLIAARDRALWLVLSASRLLPAAAPAASE